MMWWKMLLLIQSISKVVQSSVNLFEDKAAVSKFLKFFEWKRQDFSLLLLFIFYGQNNAIQLSLKALQFSYENVFVLYKNQFYDMEGRGIWNLTNDMIEAWTFFWINTLGEKSIQHSYTIQISLGTIKITFFYCFSSSSKVY